MINIVFLRNFGFAHDEYKFGLTIIPVNNAGKRADFGIPRPLFDKR